MAGHLRPRPTTVALSAVEVGELPTAAFRMRTSIMSGLLIKQQSYMGLNCVLVADNCIETSA
jgi:hypothetical protein